MLDDGHTRALAMFHGTTVHGVKSLLPGEEEQPLDYYSHEGPFGRFFAATHAGVRSACRSDRIGNWRTRLLFPIGAGLDILRNRPVGRTYCA